MNAHRIQVKSPHIIVGFGAVLLLIAVIHHGAEFHALDQLFLALAAGALNGILSLGLVYGGYRLTKTGLSPADRWLTCCLCLCGAALFAAVMSLSLLIRALEGRVVGEAVFPLLIATEAGGLAGLIAGYYIGRTRVETRRAQTVSDALGFVNSLIRHDLRNDLTVVQGHARLLQTESTSKNTDTESDSLSIIAEKTDEALTRIETTGAVANTLVGDPDLERTDLSAIVAEIAMQIENTQTVSVTMDLPEHAPVTANPGLRSVVDNLLENAVEHNDADVPEVHVDVDMNEETIRLSVADNGPGIPDRKKERILDQRDTEAQSGGLSLVQTLVEGYGGEVRIEDNDPHGSMFIVELLRADGDGSDDTLQL
ncbi:ATP-binding protein [Halorubrum sp. N11]|uniref:ATP-binding protein n=1 Tax=Halorubrum sp. N11 TaxID=3402276 RepID=UPI003EBC2248